VDFGSQFVWQTIGLLVAGVIGTIEWGLRGFVLWLALAAICALGVAAVDVLAPIIRRLR
jgi:hypothetical protein